MTTVTITLEDELERTLKELADASGMTPDEAARDALKRRLSLFRFRKRQTELGGTAERVGFESENQLLDDIS
ncbi:MAG: CopG family transcriptional regulator [Opitutales bacterium]